MQGDEADPGFWQSLLDFFAQLWSPATTNAEKLGYAYLYDPSGTLLGEYGTGGASSSGTSEYIHLPTAAGPLPIVALIKGAKHAIHSDHLNTPRKLTRANNRVVWQWAYSAFGEEAPTLGVDRYVNPETTPGAGTTTIPRVEFNLRYPGQYFDREANLSYNYHRSYDARTGRYSQPDPIGLEGGWNRFGYVDQNPLGWTDPEGLVKLPGNSRDLTPLEGGGGGAGGSTTGGRFPVSPKASAPQCPPGFDRVVKDPPFNPHGQKVFTDGRNFITPDADRHNGGVWKMFDRRGNRTGTYDADLNRIGK